jgi:hypothetical protein
MTGLVRTLAIALSLGWASPAYGQSIRAQESRDTVAERRGGWMGEVFNPAEVEAIRRARKSVTLEDLAMPPDPGEIALRDSITRGRYLKTVQAYFEYRQLGYQQRLRVFHWQHGSSIAIFVVVLGLVMLGMYFAWMQFHRLGPASVLPPEPSEASEIELGLQKVRVRSSVLGVLILALSLGFFYLYLAFVYPIHDVF